MILSGHERLGKDIIPNVELCQIYDHFERLLLCTT